MISYKYITIAMGTHELIIKTLTQVIKQIAQLQKAFSLHSYDVMLLYCYHKIQKVNFIWQYSARQVGLLA